MPSNVSREIAEPLKKALGNRSPEEAWADVVGVAAEFAEDQPTEWLDSASLIDYYNPEQVLELLRRADPLKALNLLLEPPALWPASTPKARNYREPKR